MEAVGAHYTWFVDDENGQNPVQVADGKILPTQISGNEFGSDYYDEGNQITIHCTADGSPTPTPSPTVTPTPSPTGTPSGTPFPTATPGPSQGQVGAGGVPEYPTPGPETFSPPELSATPDLNGAGTELGNAIDGFTGSGETGLSQSTGAINCWESASFGTVSTIQMPLNLLSPQFPSSVDVPSWATLGRSVIYWVLVVCWFVMAYRSVLSLRPGQ
jgi:hypothetical protein